MPEVPCQCGHSFEEHEPAMDSSSIPCTVEKCICANWRLYPVPDEPEYPPMVRELVEGR